MLKGIIHVDWLPTAHHSAVIVTMYAVEKAKYWEVLSDVSRHRPCVGGAVSSTTMTLSSK